MEKIGNKQKEGGGLEKNNQTNININLASHNSVEKYEEILNKN